ncbi:hypothetical protein WICMUC_005451 [Wickerhamomyces mucosus]|uniref:Smr domain-containing protein n=1 Tax=Wickerhamomyces mucosus TaxID=1378264 RepID=A0A9P8P8X6_9ASCO|nr:hypothetical protein WICMUC_005451 [Wickerhamomyces mucosus]
MSAAPAVDRGVLISDPQYRKFRDLADQAYKKRQELSNKSQQAYKQGDGKLAHQLSEDAKKQLKIAEDYNFKAAEYVFIENNADSDGNEIDLHGLYIKEAEYILKRRIVAGIQRNESLLEVIVGKGNHSPDHIAKIKPAVETLCQESNLRFHIDPKNSGVLIIDLKGARIPQSWNDIQPIGAYIKPQGAYTQSSYNHQQPQFQQQPQVQQQPHYQQQPQYQQQGGYQQQQQQYNNNGNNNNDDLVKVLQQILCGCLNLLKK